MIKTRKHEVETALYECGQSFSALRAVAYLMQKAEGKNPFEDNEDDALDMAALLRLIADRGCIDAEEGLELAQALEVA